MRSTKNSRGAFDRTGRAFSGRIAETADRACGRSNTRGMIHCYMGTDKVVGFGHQLIKALIAPPPEGPGSEAAQPGPRVMHPASAPINWAADFLYEACNESGADTYVLCEINVSSVFVIPDDAPAAIARLALARLQSPNESPGAWCPVAEVSSQWRPCRPRRPIGAPVDGEGLRPVGLQCASHLGSAKP